MRPTVYSSPGVGVEESIYSKSTLYTSASIYKEWEDPQEYDPEDIPPYGLGLVPMDSPGWNADASFRQLGQTMNTDSPGWDADASFRQLGQTMNTDSPGWDFEITIYPE